MPVSERQLAAAHRLGQDVCVVAGPGSGKTSVLIERFSWLVRSRGVSPERILAITFTDKAATEIKERAVKAFADAPEIRETIERAYVSTIHAFCARLLREHAIDADVDPEFIVLDRARPVLREVADDILQGLYDNDRARMQSFLRSLAVATLRDGFVPDLATSLIEIYTAVRVAGVSVGSVLSELPPPDFTRLRQIADEIAREDVRASRDKQIEQHAYAADWARRVLALPDEIGPGHFDVLARRRLDARSLVKNSAACRHEAELRSACEWLARHAAGAYYAPERRLIVDVLRAIGETYGARKRAMSSLDFDDLEEFAIRLLKSDSGLRERVRASFDFILMDELQDTNPLQWRLMELVRRPNNFFAVGDVNQSIYGFRYAEPRLFSAYREAMEAARFTVDELRDNYRTRPEVLQAINRVFEQTPGVEPHELHAATAFEAKSEPSVEVITAFGETGPETEVQEAAWVAHRISELVGTLQTASGPLRYGDIALLTRANYSTAALQSALDAYGIPSVVLGGFTLYDTREVRDLKLALDVLVNPCNEVALAGLLRSPLFGCTDEDLFRLARGRSLSSGVLDEPPPHWSVIQELRRIRNQVSPDLLLRRLLDESDYESGLSERGRGNVEKFLAMLRRRYNDAPMPLARLVGELEDASPESEAPPPELANAVQLMTLHKSKGLEFPVVFLPFLHRSRGNGFPIVSCTHEHGLGVKWRNPATQAGQGDTAWYANKEASDRKAEAEENRLLYVGMTRAKEHLVLSWSTTKRRSGQWPALIAGKLNLPVTDPANEAVVVGGVRVLATDQSAPPREGRVAAAASDAVTLIEPVPVPATADGSATVTDISRFHACPRSYYLARYLGWKKKQRHLPSFADDDLDELDDMLDDLSASELGREVHTLLAGQPDADATPLASELADRFRTSALGKRSLRAVNKAFEWDFLMEVAGVVLRGQIDLWFEHNRELVLVDYKTDREIDEESMAAYSLQLQLYALALERFLGRTPDRAVLFLLRHSREIDIDVTPLALSAARDAVHRFRDAQALRQFPLAEGERCKRCDFYRSLCPAGSHRGTARPASLGAAIA
jgi:ATP-dependent helicase/nuclease subunit A